jgi:FKBP-type peptidyl-prolyl cis-trans isomerase
MKTISSYLLTGLLLLGAASCTNSGFKKTKSGLLYKIYSNGQGAVAKKGEFLKAQVLEKVRDSAIYSSYGHVPAYIPVDTPRPMYSPNEIFSLLRKGDSAVVVMLADTIQHKIGQLPPWLKKKDKIVFAFKVEDIFPTQEAVIADREKEIEGEKTRESREVEDYLTKNNIQAQKTDKGTYVVVQNEGNGPAVDSGKLVYIRYTGKSIPSMKVFESNMNGPGNEPFKFVVGSHQVIAGWDDGLKKFKMGGKGTLYIPAYLAYNDQAMPGHKAFENLAFDIEVDSVKDAPAQPEPGAPGANMMPGGRPMPGRPMVRPGTAQPRPAQPNK